METEISVNNIITNNDINERIQENQQLTIFFNEENNKLSNTIDVLDNTPFFVLKQPPKGTDVINKHFTYSDSLSEFKVKYSAVITPGTSIRSILTGKNKGNQIIVKRYPSATDELVEQVIRKLAAEGQCFVEGGHVCVAFSLYQIFTELENLKLKRSYDEIKESIEILSSSQTDLSWIDENEQKRSCKSSLFINRRTISPTKVKIKYKGKKDLVCVTLHPLVTKSIVDKTFRQFNYKRHMSINDYCARWIHKRMCHNFTWANHKIDKPYHLALDTIVQGSGIKPYASIYDTIRRIEKSIDELIKKDIIDGDKTNTVKKRTNSRSTKITDAVFNIFPTERFAQDQINANYHLRELKGNTGKQQIKERLGLNL